MNILSGFIPKEERIITIEDAAELKLTGLENLVTLETRKAGVEGKGEITIRDLIRTSLRMRPNRIIVGEIFVTLGQLVNNLQVLILREEVHTLHLLGVIAVDNLSRTNNR